MAANLSSMFAQLNNTIRQNPLAQRPDNTQAGMAERGVDRINPMLQGAMKGLTGAMGGDSAPLQTSKEAYGAGMEAIKSLDLNTPDGLTQAAGVYQKLGMQEQALQLLERAEKKKAAQATKDAAVLDSANEQVQEDLAKTKRRQQKTYALSIAKRKGDRDAISAIESDALDPVAYLQSQAKGSKNTTLADGAMLVGPDGTIIAENQKDFNPGTGGAGGVWGDDLSATMQKRLNSSGDAYREAQSLSREYGTMLEQLNERDLGAGWSQTATTFANSATGRRDEDDFFRTQAIKLKNAEAIGSLPPGPASDKDISIVMRGFPADNAGPEEIKQFLEASQRVADDVAQYEQFKSDWISQHGDERGFISAWDRKSQQVATQRYKEATPVGAIEKVIANPALRDKFQAKYHWVPPLETE